MTTTYKGFRYVPKVMGEWDQTISYEGLSIVVNKGDSYTSKKRVPENIPLTNEEFWTKTGSLNTQITNLEQSTTAQFKQTTAQFQQIDVQINDSTIYRVGKNQKFKSIKTAYLKWVSDGKPEPSVIDIFPGTYKEFISGGANNLVFRAHSGLGSVYWVSDSGYYADAPYTGGANGKELLFEDLIIMATHDGTPDFLSTTGGAYALHIDFPEAVGKTVIRNCVLVSHQDAGLGSGTRKNQEIILDNVKLFSTAEASFAGVTGVSHGALFYHTANLSGQTGQKLIMKDVYAHSLKGPAISLSSSSLGNVDVVVESHNVVGRSDLYETYTGATRESRISIQNTNNLIKMSENNKVNNSYKLNAQGSIDSTLIPFIKDLTVMGEQKLLYPSHREIESIEMKGSVDGKVGYSHSFYANGLQHLTFTEETTNKKYNIQTYVCGFSENERANRTYASIKKIDGGVITLDWTQLGTGATGTANMVALVKFKSLN